MTDLGITHELVNVSKRWSQLALVGAVLSSVVAAVLIATVSTVLGFLFAVPILLGMVAVSGYGNSRCERLIVDDERDTIALFRSTREDHGYPKWEQRLSLVVAVERSPIPAVVSQRGAFVPIQVVFANGQRETVAKVQVHENDPEWITRLREWFAEHRPSQRVVFPFRPGYAAPHGRGGGSSESTRTGLLGAAYDAGTAFSSVLLSLARDGDQREQKSNEEEEEEKEKENAASDKVQDMVMDLKLSGDKEKVASGKKIEKAMQVKESALLKVWLRCEKRALLQEQVVTMLVDASEAVLAAQRASLVAGAGGTSGDC